MGKIYYGAIFVGDIWLREEEKKTYKDSPRELLRFLRNLNEHLKEKGWLVTINHVDDVVRRKWGGFLDAIHLHLEK